MDRLRRARHRFCTIALLAILLNALAPIVSAAHAAAALQLPPGEICTADGNVARSPVPLHGGHGALAQGASCPFCAPHTGLFLIAGPTAGWHLSPGVVGRAVPFRAQARPSEFRPRTFLARGPPSSG